MPKTYFSGHMTSQTTTFFDLTRPYLEEVELHMRQSAVNHHANLDKAIDQLLSSGGKRIRPIATILIGMMLDADIDRIMVHAAAIEMLHTATLVHDDLIDGSLLRRGFPTLNAQWTQGATVLAGDYIFARAARLAAATDSLVLMDSFARGLMTIVGGEITQLFNQEFVTTHQSYLDRTYAKTASLFEVATEGAAVLSGASEETIEAMKLYGYYIGLAFQIVDDVLDFTGEQSRIGKPVASDLRHGLITLPTLFFLEDHSNGKMLIERLQKKQIKESELEQIIEDIRSSSAIDRALQQADEFAKTSEAQLELMPDKPERDALYELARYVVNRSA
ncbi:MAG TPA: polyprenyl synthetase family protein [Anaerolineales bacterium]|nr:polyprenyl synthetase family protein [Anaerolineales bacterium]